jgi:hypothetical protein
LKLAALFAHAKQSPNECEAQVFLAAGSGDFPVALGRERPRWKKAVIVNFVVWSGQRPREPQRAQSAKFGSQGRSPTLYRKISRGNLSIPKQPLVCNCHFCRFHQYRIEGD